MPDEAADRPADQGAAPSSDAAASTPAHPVPPGATTATEGPTPSAYGAAPLGDETTPPFAASGAPTSNQPPPPPPPPRFGTGSGDGNDFFTRQGLIRPAEGRNLAGVCAAIGRATDTDPVLWRVVIAVLGFFGGIGILIYLVGWLLIPSEGDTASPIEALLGRGRSQMSPVSVLILGGITVMTFAFIVDNGFRAALLGGAILMGGALLLRRNNALSGPGGSAAAAAAGAAAGPAGTPSTGTTTTGTTTTGTTTTGTTTTGEPVTAPLPPLPPPAPAPPRPSYAPPPPPPTSGGYRLPFAPHGPYAGDQPAAPAWVSAPPPAAKPPKQRSKLGRITFFAVLVVLGVVALFDVGGAVMQPSAYFAVALVTIALGLVVGAWFGRARGLIALAVVASIGLGISSAAERWSVSDVTKPVNWQPRTVAEIADRYETPVGQVILDLRQVNFTGQRLETSVQMHVGSLTVLLPRTVDTTAVVNLDVGSTSIFGSTAEGPDLGVRQIDDKGPDGVGGGELQLTVNMDAGKVEVTR